MIPPTGPTFAGLCERCDRGYLAHQLPNQGLCRTRLDAGARPVAGQVSGS